MQTPSLEEMKETARLVLTSPVPTQPQVMKLTADTLLNSSELLKSLSRADRWELARILFPHFTLPPGWRAVAEAGGLTGPQIASLIASRVIAITSRDAARNEEDFLRELLRPARERRHAYQALLAPHLLQMIEVIRTYAPSTLRSAQPRLESWRRTAAEWLRRHRPPRQW